MSLVMDIWNAIREIVASADMITLVIAAVILLGAGYMMQGIESIVTTTFVALLAFALAGYVRAVTLGGQNATDFAAVDWHNFLDLHMLTLVAYALTFAAGIAVVHAVRSLVIR